jgi:thioredoxin-like negative regulator of GroEL
MTLLGGPTGFGPKAGADTAIAYVTERDFEAAVLKSELPVLVQFTSERSRVCKQLAPQISEFAGEMSGKLTVLRVDIDRSPAMAQQLRIQSLPTFMVFAGGRLADGQAGPLGKKELRAMVDPFLPRQAGALKAPEVAQLLTKGAVAVVDTRDAAAFGRAHLPKATNIPFDELGDRIAEMYMLAGQPVLYCRSGEKTKEFAQKMGEQGVELAFLEGGMLAWEADGLPIERG